MHTGSHSVIPVTPSTLHVVPRSYVSLAHGIAKSGGVSNSTPEDTSLRVVWLSLLSHSSPFPFYHVGLLTLAPSLGPLLYNSYISPAAMSVYPFNTLTILDPPPWFLFCSPWNSRALLSFLICVSSRVSYVRRWATSPSQSDRITVSQHFPSCNHLRCRFTSGGIVSVVCTLPPRHRRFSYPHWHSRFYHG